MVCTPWWSACPSDHLQKGSPCALGLKREPPDLPVGDILTTEYPSIRSLEGDNCIFSLLTSTTEQEGGVDVFFASVLVCLWDQNRWAGILTESKNGAVDQRSSDKAGVYSKQTPAPRSGDPVVALEAWCPFPLCLLKGHSWSLCVALWLVSGLLQHFILTCE